MIDECIEKSIAKSGWCVVESVNTRAEDAQRAYGTGATTINTRAGTVGGSGGTGGVEAARRTIYERGYDGGQEDMDGRERRKDGHDGGDDLASPSGRQALGIVSVNGMMVPKELSLLDMVCDAVISLSSEHSMAGMYGGRRRWLERVREDHFVLGEAFGVGPHTRRAVSYEEGMGDGRRGASRVVNGPDDLRCTRPRLIVVVDEADVVFPARLGSRVLTALLRWATVSQTFGVVRLSLVLISNNGDLAVQDEHRLGCGVMRTDEKAYEMTDEKGNDVSLQGRAGVSAQHDGSVVLRVEFRPYEAADARNILEDAVGKVCCSACYGLLRRAVQACARVMQYSPDVRVLLQLWREAVGAALASGKGRTRSGTLHENGDDARGVVSCKRGQDGPEAPLILGLSLKSYASVMRDYVGRVLRVTALAPPRSTPIQQVRVLVAFLFFVTLPCPQTVTAHAPHCDSVEDDLTRCGDAGEQGIGALVLPAVAVGDLFQAYRRLAIQIDGRHAKRSGESGGRIRSVPRTQRSWIMDQDVFCASLEALETCGLVRLHRNKGSAAIVRAESRFGADSLVGLFSHWASVAILVRERVGSLWDRARRNAAFPGTAAKRLRGGVTGSRSPRGLRGGDKRPTAWLLRPLQGYGAT